MNFKKIASITASLLMAGMSLGFASAAAFPTPFVQNGVANAAIVYGSNAATTDFSAASSIQTALAKGVSPTGTTTINGEHVDLASGSTKIWLNTSLNTAKTTLTKSDLPTVLKQTTFSGNVDSKLTSTIDVGSNKVTFEKQPTSSTDPVIGVSTTYSSSGSNPLYTASVTMPAINFTNSDSQGETIHLFGKDFVVSTATDASSLVLFSSSQESTLTLGGNSPAPSTSVTIGGKTYSVKLITGSDNTATVSVNGESKEINEGSSKKVGGIDIAVKSVTSSAAINTVVATLLIGSNKLTFTNGSQVLEGSDDNPIDGTHVTFTGSTSALTGLSVAINAPDSSHDALLAGDTFKDPVFGSFSLAFTGLSTPLNDSSREMIKLDKSGDKGMSLTLTDSNDNEKTFDFAYNTSGSTFLGDSNSYKINNIEGATLYQNNYTMIGNEDYGHLLQLTRIYNFTGSDYSTDAVTFKDVITGDTYNMDATSEGNGRLTVDGRQYDVAYSGNGETGNVTLTYPNSGKTVSTYQVVYPTIKTKNGALVSLYEPQTITLNSSTMGGFDFPDGDGYTGGALAYVGNASGVSDEWTFGGNAIYTGTGGNTTNVNLTVGQLTYQLAGSTTANVTTLSLLQPDTNTAISAPGVVMFEGRDDSSNYEAVIVDLEANAAGTSSDPLGVNDVYFTSPSLWDSVQLQSDSDISQSVDWYGTLVTEDSNTDSQKIATISYPKEQVYANVAVAEAGAVSSNGASSLGNIIYKDSEVANITADNVIVVGGSCINTAAATVLGVSQHTCGEAFTKATGVGVGQYLIEGFAKSALNGKYALVVAGYNAADTTNAASYLTMKNPDLAKKWTGTSATEATVVTQ